MTAELDLNAIRAALAAATPGPWQYFGAEDVAGTTIYAEGWAIGLLRFQDERHDNRDPDPDGRLVANAPVWLAQCLTEIERLRAAIRAQGEGLHAEVDRMRAAYMDTLAQLVKAQDLLAGEDHTEGGTW